MEQLRDIGKKVEAGLESLDNTRRATPGPYFYTRLRARIAGEEKSWGGIAGFISRPVFALAMIGIVLLVNTWILFKTDKTAAPNAGGQVATDLSEEYNIAVTTFYNYEMPSSE